MNNIKQEQQNNDMKLSRFRYTVIYVAVIGLVLSFVVSRGDKTEVDYFDFAELVSYSQTRDNMGDISRYCGIGLDKETKNEIKSIMEDFDLSGFVKNSFDWDPPGQIISSYNIIIPIKCKSYILEVNDFGVPEKNIFWLSEIYSIDKRFYYTNDERISIFRNGELSKKIGEFIRKNESLIDGKMSNIKQEQPKYSSPMIQWLHERYGETIEWFDDRYYDFTHP